MRTMFHVCLILAVAMSASTITAQDQAQEAAPPGFEEALKLAPEHALLKKHIGKWTTETKSYFADPNKPEVSKGSATFTALFGGRYIQQTFKGEFFGMPFEGVGVTGFDKNKKKYVGTWIDSFETGIMTTEGTYDEKTNTVVEVGISQSAEGEAKMKTVTKFVDDDTMVFTMHMVQPDGKEVLGMEITYRRVK